MEATQKQKQQYKYFAFISYSSKDKLWGRKLQKKLEGYRLPARLRKKHGDLPVRVYPIFRDETDLSGVKLRSALERELDDSQYLVVICSPNSADSQWVNEEIQYFIDQGKENRILPFVVEGIPHSGDPETECFSPALRGMKEEPLGIDIQALGQRRAFLRLVAAMLNVRYDELLMRDTRRRMYHRIWGGIAGLALAVFLALGTWNNTEHSKYYNAYTYQYEIPVGIRELTKQERSAMSSCYRITTLRGKVIRLECVNAFGTVIDPLFSTSFTEYPILEFQYNAGGELISVLQKDAEGKEISQKFITADWDSGEAAIDFRSAASRLDAQTLSADLSDYVLKDQNQLHKSAITRQRNTYDDNGYLLRSLYQRDNLGTPACDGNGVYGKSYMYDERGQVVRFSNLDEGGAVHNCKDGWAYQEFVYDEMGNEVQSQCYDAEGKKAVYQNGLSGTIVEYDNHGNIVRWCGLNQAGSLTYCEDGFAMGTFQYDDHGLAVNEKLFAPDGSPVYDEDGVHEYRYTYDQNGRMCGVSYYDAEGKPVYSTTDSSAGFQHVLDEDGRVLEELYYDENGSPCYHSDGYSSIQWTYENGNEISVKFFDTQGKPMLSNSYYHECQMDYDDRGNCIRWSYYDTEGNYAMIPEGYAIAEKDYDAYGNVTEARYYTPDRQLSTTCDVSRYVWTYDTRGNVIREERYSAIPKSLDYIIAEYQYDDYGNQIQADFYGEGGTQLSYGVVQRKISYDPRNMCLYREDCYHTGKANIYEFAYDKMGNKIWDSWSQRDASGEVTRKNQARLAYDSFGNCIRIDYQDGEGNPNLYEHRYASVVRGYSSSGYVDWEEYYDENGEPCLYDGIYFRAEYKRDVSGNETEKRIYGIDGTLCKWEQTGQAAIVQRKYNLRGLPTYEEKFNDKEESLGATEWFYDSMGYQVVEETHYDGNGKLIS